MKRFLITYTYRLDEAARPAWHGRIAEFIAALENDAELRGRITYRCMKAADGERYYHLAEAVDSAAIAALRQRPFFQSYTEETKRVGGGAVEVSTLETIAQTGAP